MLNILNIEFYKKEIEDRYQKSGGGLFYFAGHEPAHLKKGGLI